MFLKYCNPCYFLKIGAFIFVSIVPCTADLSKACTTVKPAVKPPSTVVKPVNVIPSNNAVYSESIFSSSLTLVENVTSAPSATCLSKGKFEYYVVLELNKSSEKRARLLKFLLQDGVRNFFSSFAQTSQAVEQLVRK